MSDNTCNGWTNWSTWQINLWLDNEEPWYRAKQSFLRRYAGQMTEELVERFCEEQFGQKATPDMDPGDWLEVNWEEITEAFENEAKEDES